MPTPHDLAGDPDGRIAQTRDLVEELESRLREAREEAEEARRSRDGFLDDLGHELRTSLNAVTGFCELLSGIPAGTPEHRYVQSIRTAGDRIREIVERGLSDAKGGAATGGASTCFVAKGTEQDDGFRHVRYASAEVLVVDDVEANRILARGLLERLGLRVREASDGEEAIRSAQAAPPALVLMDLRMPGMGGYGAVARLRLDPRTSEVAVVAMTASVERGSEDVDGSTFDGYLEKPVHPARLVEVLDRFLPRSDGEGSAEFRPVDERTFAAISPRVRETVARMPGGVRFRMVRELADALSSPSPGAPEEGRGIARFSADLAAAAAAYDIVALERLLGPFREEVG